MTPRSLVINYVYMTYYSDVAWASASFGVRDKDPKAFTDPDDLMVFSSW